MFERFTDGARRVMVLAQDEARLLRHNYLGTEHILLGLFAEGEGVAAKALTGSTLTIDRVRAEIGRTIGVGKGPVSGPPPFTPRAKEAIGLGFKEALQLGHDYIGTEHILLGLLREGQGVAVQIIDKSVDSYLIRKNVLRLLAGKDVVLPENIWGEVLASHLSDEPRGGLFEQTLSSFGVSWEDFFRRLEEIAKREPGEGQASG